MEAANVCAAMDTLIDQDDTYTELLQTIRMLRINTITLFIYLPADF